MNIETLHPADRLVAMMNRIYRRGLTTTSGGNLSVLDEAGNIWITPSGLDKGALTREQICCVKPDGQVVGNVKPSIELPFHQAIYRVRPDIRAVVHAHSPVLTAFSIAHALPDKTLAEKACRLCGRIDYAGYAVPGSQKLKDYLADAFQKGNSVVMMKNHGVCVGDVSLSKAFRQLEVTETLAVIHGLTSRLSSGRCTGERPRLDAGEYSRTLRPEMPGSEEQTARREVAAFVRRAYRQQLFSGGLGCISYRLENGDFLITPPEADEETLEDGDLVLVRGDEAEPEKAVPPETRLHAMVYEKNPELRCIIGACPVYAMAFAAADVELDLRYMPESFIQLKKVCKASGSFEVIAQLLSPEQPALLWQNCQVLTAGGTIHQTFDRLEVLERTAQAILTAADVGQLRRLTDRELEEMGG